MSGPKLGVCYFPEHWDEDDWPKDFKAMAKEGIGVVRMGEFAWSVYEPKPAKQGKLKLDWMRQCLDLAHSHKIEVVLCTPTATPPKWLVDSMPDMLGTDMDGNTRKFGSRRHYSFAHEGYRAKCKGITEALAKAFGEHPAVIAWQTDNEYGCHDTALSYGAGELKAFRDWLAQRYQSPDALNKSWGNAFWSMNYDSFDEIELPNQTVTEANPAHWMDFRRFSSDMVAAFNKLQVDILRKHSPGRDIVHNFMGRSLDFDHFRVARDIDVAAWDSYPLGFLDEHRDLFEFEHYLEFARTGDPDFQAFHHDLYRGMSRGRWWVMEQQPGPVNWAPNNLAPRDGMVALWALEAFAHGAELVSYFRWRQLPFGQEQMHSGLLRHDRSEAEGIEEVRQVVKCLNEMRENKRASWPDAKSWNESGATLFRNAVAIVFDYESAWAWKIQPHGEMFDYFRLVFEFYCALRQIGVTVDILSPEAARERMSSYRLVVAPGLFSLDKELLDQMKDEPGRRLLGPRTASRTSDFKLPGGDLAPDIPENMTPVRVLRVESLGPDMDVRIMEPRAGEQWENWEFNEGCFETWREFVEPVDDSEVVIWTEDGHPGLVVRESFNYLCGWPNEKLLRTLLTVECNAAGIDCFKLPNGLRLRRVGGQAYVMNYSDEEFDLSALGDDVKVIHGGAVIGPGGFAVVHLPEDRMPWERDEEDGS